MRPLWFFFNFDGRISRLSYWSGSILLTVLTFGFIGLLMSFASHAAADQALSGVAVVTLLFGAALGFILLTVMHFAVIAKRYHDLDRSLLRYLVVFIPLLGPIWVLIELGCLPGTPGTNRYGPPPGSATYEDESFDADAVIKRWQEKQRNEAARAANPVVVQRLTGPASARPQFGRRGLS